MIIHRGSLTAAAAIVAALFIFPMILIWLAIDHAFGQDRPVQQPKPFTIEEDADWLKIIQPGYRELSVRKKSITAVGVWNVGNLYGVDGPVCSISVGAASMRIDCRTVEEAQQIRDAITDG